MVLTNHGAFEHSKTATVHGIPMSTKPQTLGEILTLLHFDIFSSTLEHLQKVPKSGLQHGGGQNKTLPKQENMLCVLRCGVGRALRAPDFFIAQNKF